jgi:streptomycin 6-kinase
MNKRLEETVTRMYGLHGQEWLSGLPYLVAQLSKTWKLLDLQPMGNLSYNYVLGGMQKDRPIILKLGLDKPTLQREAAALLHFAGHGSAKLLDQDSNLGALLLERVVPGHRLKDLFPAQEEKSVNIVCHIIKDLQSVSTPKSGLFPNVGDWLTTFDKNWSIPQHHLDHARTLSKYLLSTSTQSVLLHGDLHHSNILSSGDDTWLAIDPKGAIGEPTYEVGAFIRSPYLKLLKEENKMILIQSRIIALAKNLGFDEQRIRDWSYVQAVMAACWMVEDKLDPEYFVKVADVLYESL